MLRMRISASSAESCECPDYRTMIRVYWIQTRENRAGKADRPMKTYDVRCPACGRINRNVYLEETGGWMECDRCRKVTRNGERIPRTEMRTSRIGFPSCTGTHSTAALSR